MTQKIFTIPVENVLPSVSAVLEGQGIPLGRQPNERTFQLAQEAAALFKKKATPRCVVAEIAKDQFKTVVEGEGRNEQDSPVGSIYLSSNHLALFAVTIGQEVCAEIQRLFAANDFALGSMLDSAASEGAELTAQAAENHFRQNLNIYEKQKNHAGILRFSPGYCGWHISAQKSLFDVLHPDEIGMTLNESYLMSPLKSISGVILSGDKDIFHFDDTYSFCADCAEHSCRERIQKIMDQEN